MKIGILTFPNSKSYGAVLQMLALYNVCKELGYDTEIINYHNLWMKQEKHSSLSKQNIVKKKLNNLLHWRLIKGFTKFEAKMTKYPVKPTSDKNQLSAISERYGAVVCGSDQVWNPDITNYDKSYFLDFCGTETARISYAPSFGVESLQQEYGQHIKQELLKFQSLSVREEAGQQIIRQLTGESAELVIDPTLLLSEEFWVRYESKHPKAKGPYILYYTIRESKTLWKKCLELSEKTNIPILRIGSNAISKWLYKTDMVECIPDVTPDQWLYLVRNASYVVTNSFHGTAFSVNFSKNFYVEFSSLTNSRLSNLVKLLKFEDRVLKDGVQLAVSDTDYSYANGILAGLKKTSLHYLEQALHDAAVRNGKKNA